MATSSIFADFSIKDQKSLEKFADALGASEASENTVQSQEHQPAQVLTNPSDIRAAFSKFYKV